MIEIERPPVASPPFRRLVVAALITAVVVAAACEPRAPGAGGATDVSWHFSPDLSIGSLDSGGPDQFTRIAFVWADDMDRIWVGDALSYEVRVFDDEGRHVRSIGRHGAGPREFGAVQSIERGPRGDVWLADPSNRRWNVVDTAGRFVGGHPYASRMYAFGDRWGRDALLYTHLSPNTLGNLDFRMVRRRLRDSVLVPVDTIPTPSIGFGESTHVSFERDGRRMTMMIPVPFQATGMRLLLPGEGWWVGVP